MRRNRKILFVRDFKGCTGGHIKVYDYFTHILAAGGFEPKIFFTQDSIFDATNPWIQHPQSFVAQPEIADVYFLAGLDWAILAKEGFNIGEAPVINLIQGLDHADKSNIKFEFLARPAVRICVSAEIAEALLDTERTNGPIITNPNGIDLSPFLLPPRRSDAHSVFIGGLKHPSMARDVAEGLSSLGISIDIQTESIPRMSFLTRLALSTVAILLPLPLEGFFLPALEAMAVGSSVIVPDCVGNRSFCLDMYNCLMPAYNTDAIIEAAMRQLQDRDLRHRLTQAGYSTAAAHTLARERRAFFEILERYLI